MRTSLPSIAALALFVLCTIAPSAAGQSAFTISKPGTVRGEQTGSDRFFANGVEADCGRVLFKGALEKRSTTLALATENYDCRAKVLSGLPADFYHDYACDYVLHDLRPAGGSARWKADVDISCPGIDTGFGFEIYETSYEREQICVIWFLEQPDAGTAELRNLDGRRGGIEVRWDLREFEYELYTGEGGRSSLLCGSLPTDTGTDATYTGVSTVFAHDRKGNPLDLQLTG